MDKKRRILWRTQGQMQTLADCEHMAEQFYAHLMTNSVICLQGDMGAGKTQWTKFLLSQLDFSETESPTFSLHNTYPTKRGLVHHFDLHRLESQEELDSLDFWETLYSKDLVIIEWSERLDFKQIPKKKALCVLKIDSSRNYQLDYYAALDEL